jgi:hypothetical protein
VVLATSSIARTQRKRPVVDRVALSIQLQLH